jgi:hypothetical protein
MACRLSLDYWGTTTCVVSSRPACTESAEEPLNCRPSFDPGSPKRTGCKGIVKTRRAVFEVVNQGCDCGLVFNNDVSPEWICSIDKSRDR